MQHNHQPNQVKLFEGLRENDLKGMISHRFSVDKYKSKMGNDDEIIVVAFKSVDKFPAIDLMEFIERGYPFVLDADMSSGEEADGQYAIFVELERNKNAPKDLAKIIRDISVLCGLKEWKFKYFKDVESHTFSEEEFAKLVPLTKEEYKDRVKAQKVTDVSAVLNQGATEIVDIDESNNVIISKPYAGNLEFTLEAIGKYNDIKSLVEGKIQLDEASNSQVLFLEKYLGNYEIHKIDNKFLIRNADNALLIVKNRW